MPSAKILIVEDEEELAELLAYNLRKEGYSVLCAHDGLNACRLAGGERPDLILLDILLPDLDGWEICRLIRGHQDADLATTPIIMLTALGATDDRLKGLELGADAYLAKPYVLREVLIRVRQLLARRRERASMANEMAALKAGTKLQEDLQDLLFHELSNQMVVISGFSSLLARGGGKVSSEDGLQAIHRSAEYLSSLAEGFLLTRRLDAGAFELPREEVSVDLLLEELVELYRPRVSESRIVLRGAGISELPSLILNRAAVRVVLSSLIENAIKYGGEEPEVLIRLHRADTGDVLVEVQDNGPGVPDTEVDRIFDRFYRGVDSAGKSRGAGLGLYLARSLARHMEGDVTVHGAPEGGTCFVVRFPGAVGKGKGADGANCLLREAGR